MALPAPRPAPVRPAGGADSVKRDELAPDESGGALVVAAPRDAEHALGWFRHRRAVRGARHGRAAERVDAPVLEAPLGDVEPGHLDPRHEDRRGRLRLLVRVGPRERDARFARPTRVVREQQLVRVGRGRAAHVGDLDAVVGLIRELRGREVGDDVGRQVARGVVHLVEQLVAQGVGRDAAAGAGRLPDGGAAVGRHIRDRVGEIPRMGECPPVAGVVAAEALARALEQVPDHDARGQAVPVVPRPTVLVRERREEERRVGDAPGDDDVGALRERVGDRARTEVRGREHGRRGERVERFAGVEVRERFAVGVQRIQAREEVVADDRRDGDAGDAERARRVDGRRVRPRPG